MASKTHGTAYIYGIDGTYVGSYAQVTSITRTQSDKINEFVENDSGQVASSIHDDQTDVLDATFRFTASYTRPTIAAKVTITNSPAGAFDGEYRVTSFAETKAAKGFCEGKITMEKDEYLTLS